MGVSLYRLLESPHFLYFQKLSTPLDLKLLPLLTLDFKLFGHFFLLLLKVGHLLFKFFYLFVRD